MAAATPPIIAPAITPLSPAAAGRGAKTAIGNATHNTNVKMYDPTKDNLPDGIIDNPQSKTPPS